MTKKIPWFKAGDSIVTAYAERASGPGWSNAPAWVIVRGRDGNLREHCLQPDEQSYDIVAAYDFSALAHRRMTSAVAQRLHNIHNKVQVADNAVTVVVGRR